MLLTVMMELKVWVDGVVRVVCGLSLSTSCQDVVIALARAIGKSVLSSYNSANKRFDLQIFAFLVCLSDILRCYTDTFSISWRAFLPPQD